MKIELLYQILVFVTHGKTLKARTITIDFEYLPQHGMINLNYLMDHITCIRYSGSF